MRAWEDHEIEALQVYFDNDYSDIEISDALSRSEDAIRRQRYRRGLLRQTNSRWCKAAMDILTDPANADLTNSAMGQLLGMDPSVVYRKRQQLGLKRCTKRFWTEDEIDILVRYYPANGAALVGEHTGWGARAVESKARSLGIKRRR